MGLFTPKWKTNDRSKRIKAVEAVRKVTNEKELELILEAIRTVSRYAIENETEFVQKIRSSSQLQKQQEAKELKRQISREEKRSAELDLLIKKLYESYALERISESRFEMLSREYEQEQAELIKSIAEHRTTLEQFQSDNIRIDSFMALVKKYRDFPELTTPMINEFVEKILVHTPVKINGERCMDVDIYFKFIGKFEIPTPELTPEEIAEQEKRAKKRAIAREKYRLRKERKKQKEVESMTPSEQDGVH